LSGTGEIISKSSPTYEYPEWPEEFLPYNKDRHFDFQPDKQFAAERASLMFLQDLLKALPAIATVSPMNNKATASFFAVPSDRKIIAFVNIDAAIPPDMFAKIKFPVEVTICPIRVPEGKTIDDVIRIYELEP